MNFLKTTAIGGVLFLVPFVVVSVIVAKAFDLVRTLVLFIESKVPMITVGGIVVMNLIVVATLVLLCFLAGLLASSNVGQRLGAHLDTWLLGMIPGYSFIKGITDSYRSSDEQSRDFVPVVAHFDDNMQLAFEVERTPTGKVVLYLPGCPDPWSGSVIYMTADRVEPIQMTVKEALKNLRTLGRGSSDFAGKVG